MSNQKVISTQLGQLVTKPELPMSQWSKKPQPPVNFQQKVEPPKVQPKQEQKSVWPPYTGLVVGLILCYAHAPTGVVILVASLLWLADRKATPAH